MRSEPCFFEFFFDADLCQFFSISGGFWGVLGGQNGGKNRVLGGFVSMFFSSAFRHRFFVEFGRLRTLKICTAPRREHDFHEIDVFEQSAKKLGFWSRFRRLFADQNEEKSEKKGVEKHVFC